MAGPAGSQAARAEVTQRASPATAPGGRGASTDRTPIERSLVGLRRLARTLLAVDAVAIVALALLAAAVAMGVFDYVFLAPLGLRWAAWGVAVLAVVLGLRRLLVPSINFRPSLSSLALRVEQSAQGEKAGLRGVLASGLEFARAARPRDPMEAALADRVTQEASERFSSRLVMPVLRPRRPAARLGAVALALAATAGAWAMWPGTVGIGAARVLAPWSGATWPTRTALADATQTGAHDIGRPLTLEADLTRTDRAAGQTRVWANYRLRVDGQVGPTRRVAMMWQPSEADAETAPTTSDARGERYTWLHADLAGEATDLSGEARGSGASASSAGVDADARPVEFEIEYWFQTADARTDPARVLIVEPPMVVGASLHATPPPYVTPGLMNELSYVIGEHDLGPGTDERAKAGPILDGSLVRLAVTFNKPLGDAYATPEGVLAGFGLPLTPHGASASVEGPTYTITATVAAGASDAGIGSGLPIPQGSESDTNTSATIAAATIEIPIRVTDRHGLRSERESMFRLALATDQNPTATVTEPAADESVLATAVIDLEGEGVDDVGISGVALERQRMATPADSQGASPEPVGAAQTIVESTTLESVARRRTVGAGLDLSTLGLHAGDELWITARAHDVYFSGAGPPGAEPLSAVGDATALRHAPARSAPRRLRVISETELIDQLRADLAGVREAAVRLDDAQARLLASVTASGPTTQAARGQGGVTASIEDQARFIERLAERIERNRLADESLSSLVEDVRRTLDTAAGSSGSATGELDEAVRDQEGRPEPRTPQERAAQEREDQQAGEQVRREQQAVRDELQRLAAMLDRGSDGWLVRRELERLLEEQQALMQETASAGAQTAGRESEQLTPDERTELERIAQRQFELAQQAQATIDELSQRARDLQEADPAQSSGMRSAAQTGRERQVSKNLEEASQQIQRNNTNTAQQQQQEAVDAMQEMLSDLEEGQRGRDQTLQRVLATLVESLDALIAEQEYELGRLGEARAQADAAARAEGGVNLPRGGPLDASMIALHTNTLGVVDLISTGYPELTSVQRMVQSAATAQGDAIVALREAPIGYDAATEGQTTSLTRLREARAEAKRMEEQAAQRENARKRRELRQAYRAMLEQQVGLRSDVEPYVDVELSRRQRSEVRTLGESQEALRAAIDTLRQETAEMGAASVFLLAHARLDGLLSRAAGPLREGRAEGAVLSRQQSAVEILQSLVEALDDSPPEQDPFAQSGGGAGGGGGGGGGQEQPVIMPVYELRLLRGMQAQALGLTRDLDAEGEGKHPEDVADLATLQRLLADEATALIQRMQQPPAGGTMPPGTGQGPGGGT